MTDDSPFEYYNDLYPGAGTGADLRAAVEDPRKHASTLDKVAGDLETDGHQARGQAQGAPAPVAKNPAEAAQHLRTLSVNGQYACGVICRFASFVDSFDAEVLQINLDYQNGQDMGMSSPIPVKYRKPALRRRWNKEFDKLEKHGDQVSAAFAKGPSEVRVKELILEGHLPLTATKLYPGMTFTTAEKKTLAHLFKDEATDKSPTEIAGMLQTDPSLVGLPGLASWLTKHLGIKGEAGADDGKTVSKAFDDPLQLGRITVTGEEDALARLSVLTQIAKYQQQHGQPLSDDQAAYLKDFYSETDGNLIRTMQSLQDTEDWSEDPESVEQSKWMRQALANGALQLTDEALHKDFGQGDHHGLPPELWDAMHDTPQPFFYAPEGDGQPQQVLFDPQDGDGFKAFAGFLSESTTQGGVEFSHEATDTAADVARLLNRCADEDITQSDLKDTTEDPLSDGEAPQFDKDYYKSLGPYLESVVDVASRNDEANLQMFEQMNDGSEHGNDLKWDLAELMSYGGYPDDGRAVGGYTDTVTDLLKSPEGSPEYRDGQRASANVINFLTSTDEDDGVGVFRKLMADAHDGSGDKFSIGDLNPELVRSLSGVVTGNLDQFGESANITGDTDVAGGKVKVGFDDAGRMFTLVNTDETTSNVVSKAVETYLNNEVDHALKKDAGFAGVGERVRGLAALQNAGIVNSHLIEGDNAYDNAETDAERKQARADAEAAARENAVSWLQTGIGKFDPTGGFVSNGTGLLLDDWTEADQIPRPDVPSGVDSSYEHLNNLELLSYKVGQVMVASGHDLPPGLQSVANQHGGTLPAWDDLSADQQNRINRSVASQPWWGDLTGVNTHGGWDSYESYTEAVVNKDGSAVPGAADDYLDGVTK